jgi:hypothetical protein
MAVDNFGNHRGRDDDNEDSFQTGITVDTTAEL